MPSPPPLQSSISWNNILKCHLRFLIELICTEERSLSKMRERQSLNSRRFGGRGGGWQNCDDKALAAFGTRELNFIHFLCRCRKLVASLSTRLWLFESGKSLPRSRVSMVISNSWISGTARRQATSTGMSLVVEIWRMLINFVPK